MEYKMCPMVKTCRSPRRGKGVYVHSSIGERAWLGGDAGRERHSGIVPVRVGHVLPVLPLGME